MNVEEIRGLGGWLAFLIFALLVIGPCVTLGEAYVGFAELERAYPGLRGSELWGRFRMLSWAVIIVSIGLSYWAGMRLILRREPSSVWITQFAIWLSGPCATAVHLFVVPVIVSGSVAVITHIDTPQLIVEIVRLGSGAVGTAAWSIYLVKSRRVARTYGMQRNCQDLR
ncbi:DUF2569 family protein [Pandoraea pnomenusa]|uniref:DUF2569 family protein n=1 Tax=Pandoraea pnomenusa TaxID=93220 RepID=UPI003342864C